MGLALNGQPFFCAQNFDTSKQLAVRLACCVLPRVVLASHYIAPQCPTRPTSVGLFLFGQLPESFDTSKWSSSTHDTLGHVPSGSTHRMSQ